jgi:hypothetical protein
MRMRVSFSCVPILATLVFLCTEVRAIDRNAGPSSTPAAKAWSQVAELVATNTQIYSFVGTSVALSGDTVVVGAPGYIDDQGNSATGAAYVFVKPSTGWGNSVQTAELTPSDGGNAAGDYFGGAVAVSGDTIFVGANAVDKVYVYVKPSTGWANMTETAILTDPRYGGGFDAFGASLAVSGRTLVVGADESGISTGTAYVYEEPAGGWQTTSKPTAILTASDRAEDDLFGLSVAISGNTIAVGAPVKPFGYEYGAAYVFVEPTSGWKTMTETAKLTAAPPVAGAILGWSVLVNGSTVFAGAPTSSDIPGPGSVYVFEEPASGWTNENQTAILTDGSNAVDDLGSSLGMTGNTLFVGAPLATVGQTPDEGAIYLFTEPAAGWKTTSKTNGKISALYGEYNDEFGFSVAVQGNTAVSGAPDAEKGFVFTPQ